MLDEGGEHEGQIIHVLSLSPGKIGRDIFQVDAYARSKTLAEQAAWEFWRSLPAEERFGLTVLNPTLIIGPLLSDVDSGSATVSLSSSPSVRRLKRNVQQIVGRMLSFTTFLAAPPMYIGVVDVRDVAYAHVEV